MNTEERIQRLLDKDDIEAVLYKWAYSVGRRDWPEVRSVFHDDATDAHSGRYEGNVDGFLEWQKRHHAGVEQSVHFIGSVRVDFANPELALSEAYVIAFHRYGLEARQARQDIFGPHAADQVKPMHSNIVARYIDRFEKRNAAWRIAKRVSVIEWVRFEDAPWDLPFQPGWRGARRDKTDAVYEMRRELGLPY
jgi:hypothetical protein